MSSQTKNDEISSEEIKFRVEPLSKTLVINSKILKIISKKRLEFDENGNKVPTGTRYVMLSNIRERKLIFSVDEIKQAIKALESGKPQGHFMASVVDDSVIKFEYKTNILTLDIDEREWIILAFTELIEVIKSIDQ